MILNSTPSSPLVVCTILIEYCVPMNNHHHPPPVSRNEWNDREVCVRTPRSPCLSGRDSAIYHAGNLLPSLSPGIKQSPKQIKRKACCAAARPLAAPLAPRATKEQTVIPTWLFCRGPHGALIKTGQTLRGGGSRRPLPLPLRSSATPPTPTDPFLPATFPRPGLQETRETAESESRVCGSEVLNTLAEVAKGFHALL